MLERASRDLAIRYAVADALASSTTLADVGRRALSEICAALGWDVGALWLIDEDADVLRCAATWRTSEKTDDFARDTETRAFPPGIGLPGRAWSRAEPQWSRDFANDPAFPRAAVAAKAGLHAAFAVPVRDGERIVGVLEFFSADIREPDGELLALFAAVGRQIGQVVSLAVENARLYREAREALRARDEFLSTVSHDLRNPLASVKGLAQLLARRALRMATPETISFVESLERIDASATRMATILDELIEVSGLRIGQSLEITRAPVDLVALAREVAHSLPAEEKRIDLQAPEPAVVVAVDAARMQRVLANLVGNALKFSAPGAAVHIRVARADGAVAITIRDQGVGIPAADLPHIFERFRRGSNVAERIPGTGIGLTSAKQIVELHGGSIDVESVEGEGSTFTIRLPLDGGTARRAP